MNNKKCTNLAMLPAVLLAGCISTSSPKLKSESAPPPDSMAVVLVRLTAAVDDKAVNAFAHKTKICFLIENEDDEQPTRLLCPVAVHGKTFRQEGWAYLLLEPGTYRITAKQDWVEGPQDSSAAYRLYVPTRHPLLYAGSFHANSYRIPRASIMEYLDAYRRRGAGVSFEFEREPARQVAQTAFCSIGPLMMAQLQPTDILSPSGVLSDLGSVAIATTATKTIEPPNWSDRAEVDYVKAATVPRKLQFTGIEVAYNIPAAVIAAVAGGIEGTASSHKWAGPLQELSDELADYHPAAKLQNVLLDQFRQNGVKRVRAAGAPEVFETPAAEQRGSLILRGEVRKVRLVQGTKRQLISTEVILRFRLLDAQADNCFYNRDFSQKSEFKKLKDYSGDSGRALFRKQLTDAINAGVEQFVHDIVPVSSVKEETQLQCNP
jgi:hypothetical protein